MLFKRVSLLVELKMFMKNPDNAKFIKYDWDAGHCYSYIKHPLADTINDLDDDELTDTINSWMYDNDDCPPCEIHVYKDGTSGQGCCGHGNTVEETNNIISELTQYCKDNDCMKSLKYMITRENKKE